MSALAVEMETELLIGDGWTAAEGGATLPVEDPATGEMLAEVADATEADALAALAAADAAQAEWAGTAPRERAEILRRAFEAVIARCEELSLLMTLEMGKPLAEARAELAYGAEFLRWFSEEAVRVAGRYALSPTGDSRMLVSRAPVGPCLLITPWNFPLAMATRKVAPPAARWCSSRPPRRRSPRWRSPASCATPACRRACSTSSPPPPPAARWRR
jgi:succinate-semialdehyde dehydrogenase/glutarate-semialdehyde dehydrogenase